MSVNAFEIPLLPAPQTLSVQLGQTTYSLTVLYRDNDEAGWTLDIYDAAGINLILGGVPLVTGVDLLDQFDYLDFGGQLVVQTDHDPAAVPTFGNLGVASHLYWVPD